MKTFPYNKSTVLHVLGLSLKPKIYNLAQYREHKHVAMSSATK